jgi:hypothetical protein
MGAYEAVYLEEDGTLSRLPILGVLIEEEVTLSGSAGVLRTGNTRDDARLNLPRPAH